jgi:hypothetical protein
VFPDFVSPLPNPLFVPPPCHLVLLDPRMTGIAAASLAQYRTNPVRGSSWWRECVEALIWINFGKKEAPAGGLPGLRRAAIGGWGMSVAVAD